MGRAETGSATLRADLFHGAAALARLHARMWITTVNPGISTILGVKRKAVFQTLTCSRDSFAQEQGYGTVAQIVSGGA